MKSNIQVTVIGAGYVGLTTAALLAKSGTAVSLLDVDSKKIASIKAGRVPFFETGLDSLVAQVIKAGRLTATTDYAQAVSTADIIFCCVGTPDRADGSSNLDYVFAALESAAKLAKDGVIFVQKSTVPVGTGKSLVERIVKVSPKLKFSYVSNPEFLREGTAIEDSLKPDRTVLGGPNPVALRQLVQLYKKLYGRHQSDFILTTLESAELIKVTANAFLALKISFANSIAKLCDSVGADINEVMDGIGKDQRIGRAFLNAGRGYGGGCFPKDVSGLIATAADNKVKLEIMSAAVRVNDSMADYIVDKIKADSKSLAGKKIAVLGLSFKGGTSDVRRSPAIALANALAKAGGLVQAYDPKAVVERGERLHARVSRKPSLEAALRGADVAVMATEWPQFLKLDFTAARRLMRGRLMVDAINALDSAKVRRAGLEYLGVGR